MQDRPDRYRAYVSLPTIDELPLGPLHDCIDELAIVFEGRLDIHPRKHGIAVVSDAVPADQFEADAFESVLDRIEDCYPETYTLARIEKCRPAEGRLVTSHVVVPVKPLFPHAPTDRTQQPRSATE